jgi:hypothetical protein
MFLRVRGGKREHDWLWLWGVVRLVAIIIGVRSIIIFFLLVLSWRVISS